MKLLFVFAHPDDETFSSGGTIAKLSKNHQIELICATRGEAGEVGDPPVCAQKDLGKIREQELRNAVKTLGISRLYLLNYQDLNLNKVPLKKLTSEIFGIMKKSAPD